MLEIQIEKKLPHFLVDVNLTVEDEILVLFGPSGSGKTTILNAIAGLDHPDAGRITLNGQTFFSEDEKPLPTQQRNIGYLFQDYALFPHMTVEKNIAYGVKKMDAVEAGKRIEQLVSTLGIDHLAKNILIKFPVGKSKEWRLQERWQRNHPFYCWMNLCLLLIERRVWNVRMNW